MAVDVDLSAPALARIRRLERIWEEPRGVLGWLTTTDHKRIGLLYFFTTLAFFGAGGIEALLIRTQLAVPNAKVVDPNAFDGLKTLYPSTGSSAQVMTPAAAGGSLTLVLLDQLIDLVKGGKPDLLVMSRRTALPTVLQP